MYWKDYWLEPDVKEYSKLMTWVMQMQLKKICIVFIDMSGHVDNLQISLRDKDNYGKRIHECRITYWDGNDEYYKRINPKKFLKNVYKIVDKYNADIVERQKKEEEETKQRELKQLKELQEKYKWIV